MCVCVCVCVCVCYFVFPLSYILSTGVSSVYVPKKSLGTTHTCRGQLNSTSLPYVGPLLHILFCNENVNVIFDVVKLVRI